MIGRIRLAALAVLVSGICPAAAQAKDWLRADTHNFVIYSDGSRRQLDDFARNVEQFDAALRLLFRVPDQDQPHRLTVYMLSSADTVARLAGDKQGFLAGFYQARREGSFAVANRERASSSYELSGETTLFHEYAHHFMHRHMTSAYPTWFVEGFAEYVSTMEFDGEEGWNYGRPANHRAGSLFYGSDIKIEDVLYGDFSRMGPEMRGAFYARAWLLVHKLNADDTGRAQLTQFLSAFAGGTDAETAARAAFGDLKALDKELDRYLKGKFGYLRSETPITYHNRIIITDLDEVQSQLTELGMRRTVGRTPQDTRDELDLLAEAHPDNADVLTELGYAERDLAATLDEFDLAPAEAAADRALAIDPEHVRANILKAEVRMARLLDENSDDAEQWAVVLKHIGTANRLDTENPLPLLDYFDYQVRQGNEPNQNARDALAKAFELIPEVTEVRVRYAWDLAAQGEYDQAIGLVKFLANSPHSPEFGRRLLAQLEARRDGRDFIEFEAADSEDRTGGEDGSGDGSESD